MKKQCLKCILATIAVLLLIPVRAVAEPPVYGDIDLSRRVTIADVTLLIDHLLGGETTIIDDVNGDLRVSIQDVTVLIDYLLSGSLVLDLYSPPMPDSALVITVNGVSFAMMPVEGGEYDYQPPTNVTVTLSDYYMGMTEVTMELWEAVMGSRPVTGTLYKVKPNQPADWLSWWMCQEFIGRLNELTGLEFHLPTWDQWRYAAIGGKWTHQYTYAGSEDVDEVAWYNGNRPELFERFVQLYNSSPFYTMPVGMKKPNELGLYDMSGNMMEWLEDANPGRGEELRPLDPDEPYMSHVTVLKGGSMEQGSSQCNVYRPLGNVYLSDYPVSIYPDAGFRLVLQASSLSNR